MALLLADACHDAVEIFFLLLYIRSLSAQEHFASLLCVARLELVRDTQRDDVQFFEIFLEAPLSGHIEHLEQALLGNVVAILGAAFPLGNPDR